MLFKLINIDRWKKIFLALPYRLKIIKPLVFFDNQRGRTCVKQQSDLNQKVKWDVLFEEFKRLKQKGEVDLAKSKIEEVCALKPNTPWPWIALFDIAFKTKSKDDIDILIATAIRVIEPELLNKFILHIQYRFISKAQFDDVLSLINNISYYNEINFYFHFRARLFHNSEVYANKEIRLMFSERKVNIDLFRPYMVSKILDGNTLTMTKRKAKLLLSFFNEYKTLPQFLSFDSIFMKIAKAISILGKDEFHSLSSILEQPQFTREMISEFHKSRLSYNESSLPDIELWDEYFRTCNLDQSFYFFIFKLLCSRDASLLDSILLSSDFYRNNNLEWDQFFKVIYLVEMKDDLLKICHRLNHVESFCEQLQYHLKVFINVTPNSLGELNNILRYPYSDVERAVVDFTRKKKSILGISSDSGLDKANGPIKIGVCVSGQLRGFRKAAPSLLKLLDSSGFEYEIFVHVWNNIGNKIPVVGHEHRAFTGNFLDAWVKGISELPSAEKRMFELYPNLMNSFISGNLATFKDIQEVYKTDNIVIEDDKASELSFLMDNQERMLYKIEKCYEMAMTRSDITHILRIRPDKMLSDDASLIKAMQIISQHDRVILTDGGAGYYYWRPYAGTGDQIAFASKSAMLTYSTLYSYFEEVGIAPITGFDSKIAHYNLLHVCLYNGYKILPLPDPFPLPWRTNHDLVDEDKKSTEEIEVLIKKDISSRKSGPYEIDKLLLEALKLDSSVRVP